MPTVNDMYCLVPFISSFKMEKNAVVHGMIILIILKIAE